MVDLVELTSRNDEKLGFSEVNQQKVEIEATEIAEMWDNVGFKHENVALTSETWGWWRGLASQPDRSTNKMDYEQQKMGKDDWQVDRSRKCWDQVVNHKGLVSASTGNFIMALTNQLPFLPSLCWMVTLHGKSESLAIHHHPSVIRGITTCWAP